MVFAGAGHAHLHALARASAYARAGLEVVAVSPERFWYSGMGPGLLSGRYRPEDDTVDPERLVLAAGGRFLRDTVRRIDLASREVVLDEGARLRFDLLSLDVGSRVPLERIPGAAAHALPVKPVRHFVELRERLLERGASGRATRLLVIGGGAAGVETAANALALARERRFTLAPVLVTAAARLLPGHPARASRVLERWMDAQGVEVVTGRRVVRLERTSALLDDGTSLSCDLTMVATGIVPVDLAARSGLEVDDEGAMVVGERLASRTDPAIFGGGDCVRLAGTRLDRVGVHAVRQGEVLHRNLLAAARGAALEVYRPQKTYLLILSLGDGTGLLLRGRLVLRGRWVFRLKEWLDLGFLRGSRRIVPA